MISNKKTILASWLIGLGSGLFISGILLSIILYSSNQKEPLAISEKMQVEEGEAAAPKSSEQPLARDELIIEEEPPKPQELAVQMVEVDIKPTAGAREIGRILLENNIIQDYDEFIAHVVAEDLERSLAHGLREFPLNADLETVFEILQP